MDMHRSLFRRASLVALIAVLLGLAVVLAMAKFNPYVTDLDYDSGIFAYIGSQLAQGRTPYVAAWDHKPPGVFFINALAILVGGQTRWAIWGVESLFAFGAAVLGLVVLKKQFGLVAALCGSAAWLWAFFRLHPSNFTEEYALVFSFVGLWIFMLLLERPGSLLLHAALGLTIGCSFLTRPNNAGVGATILLTGLLLWIFRQRTWTSLRGLVAVGIGFLVPLLAVGVFFALRGALQPYLEGAYLYNYYYMRAGGEGRLFNPIRTLFTGIQAIGPVSVVALVGVAAALDGLLGKTEQDAVRAPALWLCLDFVVEWISSSLGGNDYSHYFMIWLPWIGFASALVVSRALPTISSWAERHQAPLLLGTILMLSGLGWSTLRAYDRNFVERTFQRTGVKDQTAVASYIMRNSDPHDTVLIWGGGPAINFLAQRASPTAYFMYTTFDLVPSPFTERMSMEFIQDIRLHPPTLIIDGYYASSRTLSASDTAGFFQASDYIQPHVREFLDFVHQNYRPVALIRDMQIYRLKR